MHSQEFDRQIDSIKEDISDLQIKVQKTPDNISYQAKLNLMKMRLRYELQTEEQRYPLRQVY